MTINDKKNERIRIAIKKGMAEYGYTQQSLAIRMAIGKATLNRKIQNPSTFSINELRMLCDAIHITSEERALMI